MGWQDISTAPKDGEWILLKGGKIDVSWYVEPDDDPIFAVAKWRNGSWLVVEFGDGTADFIGPTHWMKVPA